MLSAMPLSAATALDEVVRGASLGSLADRHSMDEIVAAVQDAKTALRLGLERLDDATIRSLGPEGWSIATIVGHALDADDAAHRIARSLALGRVPEDVVVPYDEPGDAAASKVDLLWRLAQAGERLAEARVLAAGGPTVAHRDLGPLTARGWILFIGVHDAMHLHQAAAIARGLPRK